MLNTQVTLFFNLTHSGEVGGMEADERIKMRKTETKWVKECGLQSQELHWFNLIHLQDVDVFDSIHLFLTQLPMQISGRDMSVPYTHPWRYMTHHYISLITNSFHPLAKLQLRYLLYLQYNFCLLSLRNLITLSSYNLLQRFYAYSHISPLNKTHI